MQIETDTNASADGYITAPNGAGTGGYTQFNFNIQESGDYVIWGRVIANDAASDSFNVSIDGGTDITWHTKQGGIETWTWDVLSERTYNDVRNASNPIAIYLMTGTHTLTIKQRENGTKIDRILIINDRSYVPEGEGELPTPTIQEIWIEAEDGEIYAPMEVGDDSNASAGGYTVVPDGTGIISDPSSEQAGYAEYNFNAPVAGNYIIWGRVIANDSASDSFFVMMDGGQALTWHTKKGETGTWTWDVVSKRNYDDERDASNPLSYRLEAGTHTLRIQQREDGAKIDRILITDDMEYSVEE
jgi:hypothetical protein